MTPTFSLVLHTSSGEKKTWAFEVGEIFLGADPSCDVVLEGDRVALRQIRIELHLDKMVVEDLTGEGAVKVDGEVVSGVTEAWYPVSIQITGFVLSVGIVRKAPPRPSEIALPHGAPNPTGGVTQGLSGASDLFGPSATSWRPEVGDGYTLNREVARGGMSRIFEGEDPKLGRKVAVKVSRRAASLDDPRFFREAEVLARLAHPNIVPVYSLGRDSGGHPAYSMKLVKGRTLQLILTGLRNGERELVEEFTLTNLVTVFLKVCNAMSFAHANGYLHRDLKPENIMVGEFGEVLVMDWGLATRIGEKEEQAEPEQAPKKRSQHLMSTMDGEIVGTPQFMSPEQAEGRGNALDERSDIYALGAMLYSILTLAPPVEGGSVDEVLERVREGRIRPMPKVTRTELKIAGEVDTALWSVPEALRAVTQKAMERDRAARYRSVLELEFDLEAFQGGFATRAENASFVRHAWLLVKRHKLAHATLGLLVCCAVVFVVMLAASEKAAKESAKEALMQKHLAQENARIAEGNAEMARKNEKMALEEKEVARRTAARAQVALAESAYREFDGEEMQRLLMQVDEDLREATWQYLWGKLDASDFTLKAKNSSKFVVIVPKPNKAGEFVAVQEDGTVSIVDLVGEKIKELFKIKASLWAGVKLAVSNDGEKLVICSQFSSGNKWVLIQEPTVFSLKDGKKLVEIPFDAPIGITEFSPDGSLVATYDITSRRLQVYDLSQGTVLWDKGVGFPSVAKGVFSDDGKRVYAWVDNTLGEYDSWDGTLLRKIVSGFYPDWFLRPRGGDSFFLGEKGTLRKRALSDGHLDFEDRLTGRKLWDVSYDSKEDRIITSMDRSEGCAVLQVWSGKTGALIQSKFVMSDRCRTALHPVSRELAVTCKDAIKVWRASSSKPVRELFFSATAVASPAPFFFSGTPESWRLLRAKNAPNWGESTLELMDLQGSTSGKGPVFSLGPMRIRLVSSSGDGAVVVISNGDSNRHLEVLKRDGETLVSQWRKELDATVYQLRVSPKGDRAYVGPAVFELARGEKVTKFNRTGIRQLDLGMTRWIGEHRLVELASKLEKSADGKQEYGKRMIFLWDADTGAQLLSEAAPNGVTLSISPDGKWIAEGGSDRCIRIRNAETLKIEHEFRAHDGTVLDIAWHPTLPLLVSVSDDLSVKVWDVDDWKRVEDLRGFEDSLDAVAVTPDGKQLAIYFKKNQKLRFWEPRSFSKALRD